MQLTTGEQFLWECARNWRAPHLLDPLQQPDWSRLVQMGVANRMETLLNKVLTATGMLDRLPPDAHAELQKWVDIRAGKANDYIRILGQYMPLAVAQNLETIPMKGLWVSEKIYGDPAMRPGHDMDILIRKERLHDSIAILEQIGFGRYWPQQLDDAFYFRHHLHLELSLSDCWTWVEIHWAFDHPRTRLTIDYEAVVDRATPSELLGAPAWDPALPDLLIYLSVHLVKHMVHLPHIANRPDLERLILAEGRLMYFLDIAEAVKLFHDQIEWAMLIDLARQYGVTAILGSTLRVCRDYLGAPVPAEVIQALPLPEAGLLRSWLSNKMASYHLDKHLRGSDNPFWRYLLTENTTFILRPIRLLDFWTYAWPASDYLRRRYGRATPAAALSHLLTAAAEYVRLAFDAPYYSFKRRLKPPPLFVTRQHETSAP